jgi:hypothetical protein
VVTKNLLTHQSPFQWVPEAPTPGSAADHSPPLSAEAKKSGARLPLPHILHGIVLKMLAPTREENDDLENVRKQDHL